MLRYQRIDIYYNLLRKFGLLNVMLFFGKLYFYNYKLKKRSRCLLQEKMFVKIREKISRT